MFERNVFILHTWKEELEGEEMLAHTDNRVRKTQQAGIQRKKRLVLVPDSHHQVQQHYLTVLIICLLSDLDAY